MMTMLIIAWELPPRARRIHYDGKTFPMIFGTTSACAENTGSCAPNNGNAWNYLRVRGEYPSEIPMLVHAVELPPRARRIHITVDGVDHSEGTTSACAENTAVSGVRSRCEWNYLRVRGEYGWIPPAMAAMWELPPRARRIRMEALNNIPPHGTTSACAENTGQTTFPVSGTGNYLRVRGEY